MTTPRNGGRWLVLIAMTGSLSMILLDQTVVVVALPSMTTELGLSATGAQWVVNAYVLAMAALVALGGKLGDKFGSVTTFRWGVTLFFVASALCGLAPTGPWGEGWIIAARALQGTGAALMMPASAAVVIGAFPVSGRGRAMAIYAGISQVFLAIGPLLGGVLVESTSWRTVFWLNVPVGIATLILVRIARPANGPDRSVTIQPLFVAQLVAGVGMLVLALQQATVWGWGSPTTMTVLGAGLVLLTWFVLAQLRAPRPLVQVRLFGRLDFLGDVLVLGLVQFGLLPVIIYSSLYLQGILGMSPMECGLALLPMILALAAAAQVGGRWYDRSGVRPPALTGLLLAGVGVAGWAAMLPQLSYPPLVPFMVVAGFGMGLLISPTNTDALSRVSAAERSQASGLVQTVRQLGATFGVAAIGAVVIGWPGGRPNSPLHATDAITAGFVCSSVVLAFALVIGLALLPRHRVVAGDPADRTAAAAA